MFVPIALVESHGEELDLPEQCKEAARAYW